MIYHMMIPKTIMMHTVYDWKMMVSFKQTYLLGILTLSQRTPLLAALTCQVVDSVKQ